jgi:polyvinyl alcohol dehydrogenase (cytochrome)
VLCSGQSRPRRRRGGPPARLVLTALVAAGVAFALLAPAGADDSSAAGGPIGPTDWPSYGHDSHHSFTGSTSLSPATARTLAPAWFFSTGDAVTANPIVVGDAVYVGSWDGFFYAIDRAHGTLRWKYQLKAQTAINPSPGNNTPRNVTSDGGLVTASAWFQPGTATSESHAPRPDLVIFAGGYTLYAVVATGPQAGQLYWSHDYTGLPEQPPSPTTDSTRIFSSPVVSHGRVFVGVSSDGGAGHRGYIVAADLGTGAPLWRFETDVNTAGQIQNNGCGGVWSSPTIDEARNLVDIGVADCQNQGLPPYNERVLAIHASTGALAWVFTPPRLQGVAAGQDPTCDYDFGATVNLGSPDPVTGAATFLGIGGKDGTYYRLDPATGALKWQTNVVFGGFAGGFIGTSAFDGNRVYGATAIGDVGGQPCTVDPRDTPVQEPSIHAFGADGSIAWQGVGAQTLGSTTLAGGMTFTGYPFAPEVQIRDARTGMLLDSLPLASDCFCSIAVAGNGVYFGTGSPQQGSGDGIYAYTPVGTQPQP